MFRQSVLLPFRLAFLLLIALHGLAYANEPETTKLEPGKHFQREIAGTEVHSYQLDLLIDQYALVTIDQRGIDLAIWTYEPNGQKIAEVDGVKAGDYESIIFVGATTEPYRLGIRTTSTTSPAGQIRH